MPPTTNPVIDKFARLSGARLVPPNPDDPNQILVDIPATTLFQEQCLEIETAAEPETKTFIQNRFTPAAKPWQRPGVKLAVIAIPTILATFALVSLVGGDFKVPWHRPTTAASPSPAAPADDTKPPEASAGDLQAVALSRALRPGFDREGNPTPNSENPNPGSTATPPPQAIATPPTPTVTPAPAPPPPRVTTPLRVTTTNPGPYRSFSPSRYRPPTQPNTPARAPMPRPTNPDPQAAREAAHQRWLALMMATSTSGGDTTNPGRNEPSPVAVPTSTTTPRPQPTVLATRPGYLSSEQAILDGQPQVLIPRSTQAKGRLLMGLAFTPDGFAGLAGQPVEIAIEDPLNSQLPVGSRLVASVDVSTGRASQMGALQMNGAVVRLIPTALVVGNVEIPLDTSALVLTGKKGRPLIAKAQGAGFWRSLLGTVNQGVGLASFGASQNAAFGERSYLTSIGANIGTTLLGNATQRFSQPSLQQSVLVLAEQTAIQVNVVKPLSLPPLAGLGGGNGQ